MKVCKSKNHGIDLKNAFEVLNKPCNTYADERHRLNK